jgi:hypothetical protein
MKTIAIDTGSNGAIAVYQDGLVSIHKLEGAETDDWFPLLERIFDSTHGIDTVVIEKPPYFMGTMIPSSRIAVLFECYGMMVGYLMARGIRNRLVTVTPQDWQRFIRDELGIKRGEMKHAEWKRHLTEYAKEKFKGEKVTGQTADARLILDWWMRHGKNNKVYAPK